MKRPYLFLLFFITTFLFLPLRVFAQNAPSATGLATTISVSDKTAKSGDIVSFQNGAYILSEIPYDPTMYGVLSDQPALAMTDSTEENGRLAVTSGKAYVLVTAKNGDIKKGDLITSSTTKGVGQKATVSGYIVGSAEEDFSGSGTQAILVDIHPELSKLTLTEKENPFSKITKSLTSPQVNPLDTIKYLAAALLTISAFIVGFMFFGRATNRGIEAIGRNPLAKRIIISTVVLNVFFTLLIMVAGVAMSYLILVL